MVNYTQLFLELVEQLKVQGNSYAAIARRIGIKGQKISDMKAGRSSASPSLIEELKKAYPEVSDQSSQPISSIEEEIKKLIEEQGATLKQLFLDENQAQITRLAHKISELDQKVEQLIILLKQKRRI